MSQSAQEFLFELIEGINSTIHFFPWHENPEYKADPANVVIPQRLLDYYDELYSKFGIELIEQEYCAHWTVWASQILDIRPLSSREV